MTEKEKYSLELLEKEYKELTKEETLNLSIGTLYFVYNPLIAQTRLEVASTRDIVHNKHCYDKLRFFIVEKVGDSK